LKKRKKKNKREKKRKKEKKTKEKKNFFFSPIVHKKSSLRAGMQLVFYHRHRV
jgi:citrate lyase alpha subunit